MDRIVLTKLAIWQAYLRVTNIALGDGLNLPEQSYYTNGLAMRHVPFLLKGQ